MKTPTFSLRDCETKLGPWPLLGATALLLLALPSHNPSVDALGHAGQVRHGVELFLPHHLLYNPLGWLLHQALPFLSAHRLLQVLSAAGATVALGYLYRILRYYRLPALPWAFAAMASWSFLRYGTQIEIYWVANAFSMGALWCLLRHEEAQEKAWLWGFLGLSALAVLMHQIQVFPFLAGLLLLASQKNWRALGQSLSVPLAVLLVYWAVLTGQEGQPASPLDLLQFLLHDYLSGTAGFGSLRDYALFSAASLVRTFLQVHGYLAHLLEQSWLWAGPGLLGSAFLAVAAWGFFRKARRRAERPKAPFRYGLWAMGAVLAFAIFSTGNVEFMTLVPLLLAMVLATNWQVPRNVPYWLGAGLLVWNLSYGLLPYRLFRFFPTAYTLSQFVAEGQKSRFIARDPNRLLNTRQYHSGHYPADRILKGPRFRTDSSKRAALKAQIASGHRAGVPVFTDAVGWPKLQDRAAFSAEGPGWLRKHYRLKAVDSTETFYGKFVYHRVLPPKNRP